MSNEQRKTSEYPLLRAADGDMVALTHVLLCTWVSWYVICAL